MQSAQSHTPQSAHSSPQPAASLFQGMETGSLVTAKAGDTANENTKLPKSHAKAKVLVIEDNLINQKIMCKQLSARGYAVQAANHGIEALKALKDAAVATTATSSTINRYFSIVLCDIEMPVMNGIICVQNIRRLEHEGMLPGRIPVVAVTANDRSIHVEKAMEAGMDNVTTKPYSMDELVKQIERIVNRDGEQ